VAGAAAYYVSLISTGKPFRRLVMTVLLPSLASLLAIPIVGLIWFPDETGLGNFMLESVNSTGSEYLKAIPQLILNLGTGLQFATAGFVLVAIFAVLFCWGRATLPIRLTAPSTLPSLDTPLEDDHPRTMLFVWMMIGLMPLAFLLEGVMTIPIFAISRMDAAVTAHPAWISSMDQFGSAFSLLVLVFLALGKRGRESVRKTVRLPSARYLGLAMLFPIAIVSVWPLISYLHDRIHWAASGFGRLETPHLGSYFALPAAASLWYLVPAFIEETAWRGYLQPRFVRRYGAIRGIFLVGIAWGAFHFSGDFRSSMTLAGVLIGIATRLIDTVVYSYVLAWLTIESQSILPATVAHAFSNILVFYSPLPVRTPFWSLVALWAIAGFILFRYFPPPVIFEETARDSTPNFETAL
jgi:membrane protease YdiL (CAAX protease family)